jgi:hypothetical protein
MKFALIFATMILFAATNIPMLAQQSKSKKTSSAPGLAQLEKMTARFAPTPLRVDTSRLSAGDRQALVKLIEAGRLLDNVFMMQYWKSDIDLYARLQRDKTPLGKARLRYFWINKGPWSVLDGYKAFLPGVPSEKPRGANFYPEDMTGAQFESWAGSLTKEEQEQAKGFFTVIRWKDEAGSKIHKDLVAIPFSEEYKDDLTPVS